jgi:hypothetical protein
MTINGHPDNKEVSIWCVYDREKKKRKENRESDDLITAITIVAVSNPIRNLYTIHNLKHYAPYFICYRQHAYSVSLHCTTATRCIHCSCTILPGPTDAFETCLK